MPRGAGNGRAGYDEPMSDVIAEYRQWKQQGGDLRARARLAMESRFRELLTEAAALAEDYRADFGVTLKPPPLVTSFRYLTPKAKRGKAKKPAPAPGKTTVVAEVAPTRPAERGAAKAPALKPAAKSTVAKTVPAAPVAVPAPVKTERPTTMLHKRLAQLQKKLEAARSAGTPTRDWEDKIYEVEDALRLAESGE